MNPGWQVYSSVSNAQIQVLSCGRLKDPNAGFELWELLHNQPARVYLQLGESSLQNLDRRGGRFMKRHRAVAKSTGGTRQGQFGGVLCLLSLPPALCWAGHELGTTDGSGCSIRKTARICQQALSWINSEPENKCSMGDVNFKRSGLKALVFVPSTIQHFFFF